VLTGGPDPAPADTPGNSARAAVARSAESVQRTTLDFTSPRSSPAISRVMPSYELDDLFPWVRAYSQRQTRSSRHPANGLSPSRTNREVAIMLGLPRRRPRAPSHAATNQIKLFPAVMRQSGLDKTANDGARRRFRLGRTWPLGRTVPITSPRNYRRRWDARGRSAGAEEAWQGRVQGARNAVGMGAHVGSELPTAGMMGWVEGAGVAGVKALRPLRGGPAGRP
jgi:hypothetical protein